MRCCRKSIVVVVRCGRNEAWSEWVTMRTCDKREVSIVTSSRRRVLHLPHQDDRVDKWRIRMQTVMTAEGKHTKISWLSKYAVEHKNE